MINDDLNCNTIRQTIAIGDALTQAQKAHVSSCMQCLSVHRQMLQLDGLVKRSIPELVPQGFSERVMARLPAIAASANNENLLGEKLLAMVSQSRMLQTLLLGLGMAVGFTQIVRFFLSIFIASMAAAC